MLTKGAIGNLVNRYKAVLKKCNLINTFGSLAVASMLVMGGAGVAGAADIEISINHTFTDPMDGHNTDNLVSKDHQLEKAGSWWIGVTSGATREVKQYGSISYSGVHYESSDVYPQNSVFVSSNNSTLKINNIETIRTENNANEKACFFNAFSGGDFIIDEIDNITIENVGIAFQINKNTGDSNITLTNVNNIYVNAGRPVNAYNTHGNAAKVSISANNIELNSTGDYGLLAYNGGDVELTASENITINSKNSNCLTMYAYGGSSDSSKIDIVAKTVNIESESIAIYSNNNAEINVGKNDDFEKATIVGDIYAAYTGSADINLGKGGSLSGTIIAYGSEYGNNTISLDLGADSIWDVTGNSWVTDLTTNSGIISLGTNYVEVDSLAGENGTLKTVVEGEEAAGQLNVSGIEGTTPELNVVPVKADGSSFTADELSQTQLASIIDQTITSDTADTANALADAATATAAAGIVNDTVEVNSKGEVVSGGGASSVTKAVLEAASVNTVALDRILTNDVRKRMGDIRSDANKTGVWMRWDGGKLKGDAGLTNEFNTIQIGGDTKVGRNCRLGVAGSFTHGDGDFARGSSELEGFSFAAYATWMGENGMFADIVARLGHFSTEVNVEGQSGDMDNRVASISGEYGWRFNLCNQFFIEPQVELAYTYVNSDDLELETARFSFDSVDSLTGRAGLVAGWNLPDERGNVYARASVVQQFMGDAKVTGYTGIAPTIHETDGDDTWLEYGIGANVKLTDNTYIWADVERTEGAEIDEEWRGTVGVRFSF